MGARSTAATATFTGSTAGFFTAVFSKDYPVNNKAYDQQKQTGDYYIPIHLFLLLAL
jgi:hypothetical protein